MTDKNTDGTGLVAQEIAPQEKLISFSTSKNPNAKNPTWASKTLTWDAFKADLKAESEINSDRSPAPGFLPALLVGDKRRKTAVAEIAVAMVEVVGVNLDEIAKLIKWRAAVVSTWENARTETLVKRDDFVNWNAKHYKPNYGGQAINATSVAYYAGENLGWMDTAASIEIIDENHATAAGAMIVISHDPLPAFLVAIPFATPYRPSTAAKTHAVGMKMWPAVLATVEHGVSGRTALPKEAMDPAAIIRAPRTSPTSEPIYMEFDGALLDWTDLGVEEPAESEPVEKKKRVGGEAWMDRLMVTKEGRIITCLPNVHLILMNDPRTVGIMAFNGFTSETVLRTTPGVKEGAVVQLDGSDWTLRDQINGDLWADGHDHALRAMLESDEDDGGYNLRVSDRDLAAAVSLTAKAHAFHPVRDYLNSQTWDQTPRVEGLFVKYLGAPDDPYHREVAKLMSLGAVARAFEPGTKVDESVILEGLQGARKTTFIQTLGVHWSGELSAMDDDKAAVEQTQGIWIAELGELTGMAKADVRKTKAFLTRTHDKVRLAYARRASLYPRGYICIGSTNDTAYLRDPSGGRRFLPVACNITGTIDIDGLRKEIDQLWAEAVQLYRKMREAHPVGPLPLWLSDKEASVTAKTLQASRTVDTVEDMMAGQIEAWLGDKDEVCLPQVWVDGLGRYLDAYNNATAASLGHIMRTLPGWRAAGTRKTFKPYGQQRVFEKVKAKPSPATEDNLAPEGGEPNAS